MNKCTMSLLRFFVWTSALDFFLLNELYDSEIGNTIGWLFVSDQGVFFTFRPRRANTFWGGPGKRNHDRTPNRQRSRVTTRAHQHPSPFRTSGLSVIHLLPQISSVSRSSSEPDPPTPWRRRRRSKSPPHCDVCRCTFSTFRRRVRPPPLPPSLSL
jgi:hypothetical protein